MYRLAQPFSTLGAHIRNTWGASKTTDTWRPLMIFHLTFGLSISIKKKNKKTQKPLPSENEKKKNSPQTSLN